MFCPGQHLWCMLMMKNVSEASVLCAFYYAPSSIIDLTCFFTWLCGYMLLILVVFLRDNSLVFLILFSSARTCKSFKCYLWILGPEQFTPESLFLSSFLQWGWNGKTLLCV